MNFFRSLQAFFFSKQTARGFGLMRIAWAAVAGTYFLLQWKDVAFFYSNDGFMNPSIAQLTMRSDWHFTLLNYVTSPAAVFALYLLMIICMIGTAIGVYPRFMLIMSVLLMFSFHERDTLILGGGDTLLRNIGFILVIAPGIDAFSLRRLDRNREATEKNGSPLLPPTMPCWPYRLLLWQMIVLYCTSFWYKLIGTMWIHGTAIEAVLHHPFFSRLPADTANLLMPFASAVDWTSLAWEGLWLLLLVPRWLTELLPPQIPRIPLKRILMIFGIFFHLAIFTMMDAGSFSLAVLTAYLGLLQADDIVWLQRVFRSIAAWRMLGRKAAVT